MANPVGVELRCGVPLGPLTTYRVGGPAATFAEVATIAGLEGLAALAADRLGRPPVLVVGQGSNLLVADDGFDGLAVQLGPSFHEVNVRADDAAGRFLTVAVGGAARLPVVARRLARAGLTGFEWAVGVPGSMGGAVRMNAGGHGSDLAASLLAATVTDLVSGATRRVEAAALQLGYRRSALRADEVVVEAELRLQQGDAGRSLALLDEIVAWRRQHQPGGHNAGSVFTNPPGDSAGRLIDAAGAKGLRVGSASVSVKHANFIQSDPGGRANDIWSLMHLVAGRVRAAAGVELHPETVMVGFPFPFGTADAVAWAAEHAAAVATGGAGERP